jgi:mono/diheme cytochrome c family protein
MTKMFIVVISLLLMTAALLLGRAEQTEKAVRVGSELAEAPPKAATRENPYAGQAQAVQAGRKLFERHCAPCHGDDGRGNGKVPDLHADPIYKAPPGALFWFLRNGNIREGMPSWSRLPDQQLWQLVTYLQSLR